MMPSRLRNKLLFITAIIGFLFTLCLPAYSGASNYFYDDANRLIRVEYENGSIIKYAYDESGNLTQKGSYNSSYTITVTAGSNGSISPGTMMVSPGSNQTFTITPASGYAISDVLVDGVSVGPVTSYTFSNVTANHRIIAIFVYPTVYDPCSGGTAATVGAGIVRTFTSNGTLSCLSNVTAAVLVVAGGGGGGGASGGGAGGLVYNASISVTAATPYSVTVGDGGIAGSTSLQGGNGSNSVFSSITAVGGGGGGKSNSVGSNGGSGGGGGTNTSVGQNVAGGNGTLGQGYAGGTTPGQNCSPSGGGGGAGGAGGSPYTGGVGLAYSISGSSVYYAGGGGGGSYCAGYGAGGLGGGGNGTKWTTAGNGTPNTGGGGGGGNPGGSGGSGIVIVRYLSIITITATAGSNGSISPGTMAVPYNSNQTYTITPVAGYAISDVLVDGVSVGAVTSYTFSNVTANHSISARFGSSDFILTVLQGASAPLTGVNCYAFTAAGAYLGLSGTTSSSGQTSYNLSNGSYKFRVDYLGYQFWSSVTNVPATLDLTMVIPMSAVVVNVGAAYGATSGIKVYLFSETGSYLGIYALTDAAGNVTFNLPVGGHYKLRYDILGNQYWSDVIIVAGGGANNIVVNAGGGTLQANILQAAGIPLTNVTAYLFSGSGSYLGMSQKSDAAGKVSFAVPQGTYKIRADYLGYQFWSDATLVGANVTTDLLIAHKDVNITVGGVFQGAFTPLGGINVYLYNSAGSYMGKTFKTDAAGKVVFSVPQKAYKARVDYLGQQYWSAEFTWQDKVVNIPLADAAVTVTGSAMPHAGVPVYVYTPAKSYLGVTGQTAADGTITLRLPAGTYKFRADYMGSQFWSEDQTLIADQSKDVNISVGGGNFSLTVKANADPVAGVKCYVYNDKSAYLGVTGSTDISGKVMFAIANGAYKFRADYLGYQFWSSVTNVPATLDLTMVIPMSAVVVNVGTAYGATSGVKVYLYSETGSYLGIYALTDAVGNVTFDLPVGGHYKLRYDIMGNQYWSDVIIVAGGGANNIVVNAGGGVLQVNILKAAGVPLTGVTAYLFNQNGSYLGISQTADAAGKVAFNVPRGTYKVRVDYLGYQFWSPDNIVNSNVITDLTIPHKDVTITVGGLYQGSSTPLANVNVYLYNSLGSYMGKTFKTDATGSAVFNLPQQAYKVRADYLGQQYWSEEFTWLDKAVNIPLADAVITMIGAGMPRADVPVYVYSSTKSYLGLTAKTGVDGKVTFRIPSGTYKFRADYQTNQFWTDDQALVADQINNISLSDGGGNFTLTVKVNTDPLAGVKCYAYNSSGTYLGLSGVTNGNGQYIFELSTGNYKFRVDYLGYQFWTDVYSVPTQLASDLTIELSDTPVTVSAFYRNSMPLSDLNVYLFTQAGAYVNIKNVTDANGGVVFSIPDKDFKIRIDYLGRQFWANIVKGQNSYFVINEGLARVYAHKAAGPVTGATVYLFSESGAYLGVNAATDTEGNAEFTLPAYPFKFRVDVAGVQYWSQVINIIEGVELGVDVSAD